MLLDLLLAMLLFRLDQRKTLLPAEFLYDHDFCEHLVRHFLNFYFDTHFSALNYDLSFVRII